MNTLKLFFVLSLCCLYSPKLEAKMLEAQQSDDEDMVLWKIDPSETCFTKEDLKVYMADGKKAAFVCDKNNTWCSAYGRDGLMYVINLKRPCYDGEVISIPSGKCAKQVGVYKSESRDGKERMTIPVIEILDK